MRKGSIIDLSIIIIALSGTVIMGLIGFKLYQETSNKFLTMFPTDEVQQHIWSAGMNAEKTYMNMIPFLVIGAGLAVIVLAFLIPVNPIFVPISMIVWILYILVAIIFSNFTWEFVQNAQLITIANDYPLVLLLVQNLHWLVAVFGMITIIVMYSKSRSSEW